MAFSVCECVCACVCVSACLSVTMECEKTADLGRRVSEEVKRNWTWVIHEDWVRSFSDVRLKRWRGGV
jgi:hypothetical protein